MSITVIPWTNYTHNVWWGCSRVSEACRWCYADTLAKRWGHSLWSRTGPRRMMSEQYWRQPRRWNRAAEQAGVRAKVFCSSMADVFEIHPVPEINAEMDAARARLWTLIEDTPWLIWQLLTKRPENVAELAPWGSEWPSTVWLGTSVENDEWAAKRIPVLARTGARTRFLSCEPLLAELHLEAFLADEACRPHWVIVGGESGAKARPMQARWAQALLDQCAAQDVPFFFKQAGTVLAKQWGCPDKKGEDPAGWPEPWPRQFPQGVAA